MPQSHIIIIEDEPAIRDMIKLALELAEFSMAEAANVDAAKKCIAQKIPNLILLDWMLPGMSGIEFAKKLKRDSTTKDIPIIILTAKAEEENKIKGLEIGADDYITKPFSPRELIARIKTVLRRGPLIAPDSTLRIKEILLNTETHTVTINEQVATLTALEYRVLRFFMTHPNRVYARQELLSHIWGADTELDERTVDVQIRRLRKSLANYTQQVYIKTVHGSGYKFVG